MNLYLIEYIKTKHAGGKSDEYVLANNMEHAATKDGNEEPRRITCIAVETAKDDVFERLPVI